MSSAPDNMSAHDSSSDVEATAARLLKRRVQRLGPKKRKPTSPSVDDPGEQSFTDVQSSDASTFEIKLAETFCAVNALRRISATEKNAISILLSELGKCHNSVLRSANLAKSAKEPCCSDLNERLSSIEAVQKRMIAALENRPLVPSSHPTSYAAMAAKSDRVRAPSGRLVTPQARSVVVVRPKEANSALTSEQVKSALTKGLNPKQLGLQLDRVVKVGGSAVRIESRDPRLREKISGDMLAKLGLTDSTPGLLKPRLALHGVPSDLAPEEIKASIISQNFDVDSLGETALAKLEQGLEVRFKFGKRGQRTTSWVVETDSSTRKALLDKGRVYIGWDSCRVLDHIRILRCYKCQKFGHMADKCQSDPQCGYCAATGHETKDCKSKAGKPKCANCARFGHKGEIIEHEANSNKCPVYLRRVSSAVQNTDYGQDTPNRNG